MKKQYIHIWTDYDDDTVNTQESPLVESLKQAVTEYWQQYQPPFNYKHTLVFDTESKSCELINITDYMDRETNRLKPEYEKLTGHEMGVRHGAI